MNEVLMSECHQGKNGVEIVTLNLFSEQDSAFRVIVTRGFEQGQVVILALQQRIEND